MQLYDLLFSILMERVSQDLRVNNDLPLHERIGT